MRSLLELTMPRKELMKHVKKIVVKVGSTSVTDNGLISTHKMSRLVADVAHLLEKKYEVVLVSSGAIAAGSGAIGKDRASLTIPEKQAMAAVGQVILMEEYRRLFGKHGFNVGQLLLTEDDIKNRRRFLNARNTLDELLGMGIVPIINENDSVVVKEIKFGDNDTLSAHVASIIDADLLVLLSDVDGFYWDLSDPAPMEEIHSITEEIVRRGGGSGSDYGVGGMATKLRAGEMIIRFGEMMVIANAATPDILIKIMSGEKVGTIFIGKGKQLSSRKKWMALRKPKGRIVLDQGAFEAITKKDKSLLATGITAIEGHFDMGDIVEACDTAGRPLAKGVVKYSHHELLAIKGKKTAEIKKTLGISYYDEVMHRDDMVVY